jgi:membrane protein YdbS with pleckstrin-like domain
MIAPWLRWLLCALAAAIGAMSGAIGGGGIAAGLAWIFVFGDDPWPSWAEPAITIIALVVALLLGAMLARATWLWTAPRSPES